MFDEQQITILEQLIMNDLREHLADRNYVGNMLTLPNREFLLPEELTQARKDILVKLASIDSRHEMVKQTAIDYPWCPQILELDLHHFMMLIPNMERGQKIACIKTLREITGLGLKHAKDFMDAFIPTNHNRAVFDYKQAAENMVEAWKIRKRNFTGVPTS